MQEFHYLLKKITQIPTLLNTSAFCDSATNTFNNITLYASVIHLIGVWDSHNPKAIFITKV